MLPTLSGTEEIWLPGGLFLWEPSETGTLWTSRAERKLNSFHRFSLRSALAVRKRKLHGDLASVLKNNNNNNLTLGKLVATKVVSKSPKLDVFTHNTDQTRTGLWGTVTLLTQQKYPFHY